MRPLPRPIILGRKQRIAVRSINRKGVDQRKSYLSAANQLSEFGRKHGKKKI
jgi:hypothetical protein